MPKSVPRKTRLGKLVSKFKVLATEVEDLNPDLFDDETGGRSIEACIRQEVAKLENKIRELKQVGWYRLEHLHHRENDIKSQALEDLTQSPVGQRIYRYSWDLRPQDALFPPDGSWREYYRATKQLVERERIDGIQALLVFEPEEYAHQTKRVKALLNDTASLNGRYEWRLLPRSVYQKAAQSCTWLRSGRDVAEDFGIFGSRMLYRGLQYSPRSDGNRRVSEIIGEFSAGDIVQDAIRDFEVILWQKASPLARNEGDMTNLIDLEEFERHIPPARDFIELILNRSRSIRRITGASPRSPPSSHDPMTITVPHDISLPFESEQERQLALQMLQADYGQIEVTLRTYIRRELASLDDRNWRKNVIEGSDSQYREERLAKLKQQHDLDVMSLLNFREYKMIIKRYRQDGLFTAMSDWEQCEKWFKLVNRRPFAHTHQICIVEFCAILVSQHQFLDFLKHDCVDDPETA